LAFKGLRTSSSCLRLLPRPLSIFLQ